MSMSIYGNSGGIDRDTEPGEGSWRGDGVCALHARPVQLLAEASSDLPGSSTECGCRGTSPGNDDLLPRPALRAERAACAH